MKEAQKAAEALRVTLVPIEVRHADYDRAFSTIVAERADAILVVMGPTLLRDRHQIVERAAKHRLPAIYGNPELVEVGGLLSYGGSVLDVSRRVAVYGRQDPQRDSNPCFNFERINGPSKNAASFTQDVCQNSPRTQRIPM